MWGECCSGTVCSGRSTPASRLAGFSVCLLREYTKFAYGCPEAVVRR